MGITLINRTSLHSSNLANGRLQNMSNQYTNNPFLISQKTTAIFIGEASKYYKQCCGSVNRCFFDLWIRDLVPLWPLNLGSGISFFRIPDPNIIFHTVFCNLWQFFRKVLQFFVNCHIFCFSSRVQKQIIINFVIIMATKKVGQNFFHPSLLLLFSDPGSVIRDPRSRIRDPGTGNRDPGTGIRDTGSGIRDPRSGIRDPGSEIRDPRSGIRDPGSEIRDPRSGIRDPGSEIRDPGSEIRVPRSGMDKNQDPESGINIPNPQHWL